MRLLSTREARPSSTTGETEGVKAEAPAASIVKPPTKTARRRKRAWSSSERRSWLQAMASRIVCRRAGTSRGPPVKSSSRCSSPASSAVGGSIRLRAAASSMASGSPSSRWQICATAAASSSVSVKSSRAARARATNRRTAGVSISTEREGSRARSGSASDGTTRLCSPLRCSTARLVVSIASCGQMASNSVTSGAASSTCSKLSKISRERLSRRNARSPTVRGRSPVSRTPSAPAIVAPTRAGSWTGARGTNQTPSGKSGCHCLGKRDGQTRLADATGTSQGQEPDTVSQYRRRRSELTRAADQGR